MMDTRIFEKRSERLIKKKRDKIRARSLRNEICIFLYMFTRLHDARDTIFLVDFVDSFR